VTAPDHPLAVNLPETWPAILGYNRLIPRAEATVVATAGADPLLAAWQFGHGRAVAFASDCGPHWAPPDFVAWDGYATLWQNIAAIEEYLRIPFPLSSAEATHASLSEIKEIMKDVLDGGWQEAYEAIGRLRALKVKHGLPPLESH
ncbi:hypothetical protein FBQ87_08465, partial [Sphingobacteriales bacterium CHB3]|nr:hypothetical protein [Sphingobacteriales bacterium CHB3]